jgi:hypothetical protein
MYGLSKDEAMAMPALGDLVLDDGKQSRMLNIELVIVLRSTVLSHKTFKTDAGGYCDIIAYLVAVYLGLTK